ncbi:MAG: hypothetical protein KGD59_08010 [Candidatus Heimdallarchaeota archaeon]|nr:hypothetical protein [Candidatus Heimdallarchaeota archaeon]MBY8994481.1 hypothetical protein [Candidatus Heimdallarchaeota archaeon]
MFCTVNECEIYYDKLDNPKLILPGLRYCVVQSFKGHSRAEEELEELI